MDTIKKITKAVLNKNFAEAKDLLFKNLYAKASLSLDEARYSVANAVFNGVDESYMPTKKNKIKGDLVPSGGAKKMILVQKVKNGKKIGSPRPIPAMKEGAEQLDEKKMKVWSPRLDKLMKNRDKIYVKPPAWLKRQKQREQVKEETEQLDEVMTRKHFQQVADVIKAHPDAKKREELAAHHSQIFKKSNPRFDEGRFRKACGIGGCKEGVEVSGEQLDEVSPPGMEKMTGSPRVKASFKKQYGKRGKSVMYATAWKMHNKKKD